MPRLPPEQQGALTNEQAQKWDDRYTLREVVDKSSEDYVAPGREVLQFRRDRNSHTLLAGEHGGWDIDLPETLIRGVPGTVVSRHVRFDSTAVVEGVTFYSPGTTDNNVQLITVGPNAVVVFNSCRFYKTRTQGGSFIKVEAGGKVILNGVDFGPVMTSAGTLIDNAGAALDVLIVGANRTGWALGTASAVGVV